MILEVAVEVVAGQVVVVAFLAVVPVGVGDESNLKTI